MAKLIMCKGLPGSGKSTWAANQSKLNGSVVVNKDTIRRDLGKPWSNEVEKEVLRQRDWLILNSLKKGYTVISDDTNLSPKHEHRLRHLAKSCGAEFSINDDFLFLPLGECINRDSLRPDPTRVGEKVILDMFNKYLAPKTKTKVEQPLPLVPYVDDPTLPSCIICDLDGTLALFDGLRGPFDYIKCSGDKVNQPIKKILTTFFDMWGGEGYGRGYRIIYLSGREDKARNNTDLFLNNNDCPPGPLYMRKSGDYRKDSIVKLELFDANIRGKFRVEFVLDDRDQVVKMWRDLGLTCLQVNYGNF